MFLKLAKILWLTLENLTLRLSWYREDNFENLKNLPVLKMAIGEVHYMYKPKPRRWLKSNRSTGSKFLGKFRKWKTRRIQGVPKYWGNANEARVDKSLPRPFTWKHRNKSCNAVSDYQRVYCRFYYIAYNFVKFKSQLQMRFSTSFERE
jgi:hypothetical protein